MCRFHRGELPVMKLVSRKLGQLIGLCCTEIVATSPGGDAATRPPVPDCVGPNGKTFPPNDNASWSSLVVPMLGCIVPGCTSFKLRSRSPTRRIHPVPFHTYVMVLIGL